MNIEETFTLDAPVPQVYAFLSDVHRVAACVPGVGDVTQREDGAYEATLQIQMGPIKAAFAGEVTLTTTENPYRIEAHGRGRDKRSGSRAEVLFGGELEPEGDAATRVATSADITIRGRLGQFGTGVIRATATEVIRDFVACANGVLGEERAPAVRRQQHQRHLGTRAPDDLELPAVPTAGADPLLDGVVGPRVPDPRGRRPQRCACSGAAAAREAGLRWSSYAPRPSRRPQGSSPTTRSAPSSSPAAPRSS
jgi:uncharacterized protein